jgi:flagellar export protein FliJ
MSMTPQRLRRLVRYRERLERLQELELAAAQRLYQLRLASLESAQDERERALDAGVVAGGAVSTADLLARVDYLRRADREIGARRAALAHSTDDVNEEREALLERRRARKAMETLLDRRLEEDRMQAMRDERRQIDEVAVTRWKRPPTKGST